MEEIRKLVREALFEIIKEGRFDTTSTPHNSHADVRRNLGHNPLYTDNGGHSAHDTVSQVSTFDTNGQNFKTNGNNIVISDNKFIIYKIKNFGNDKIESTLDLFGRGAGGEKELRRAIDTINGAANRNGRSVKYRTITSDSFKTTSQRTGQMSKTFWEFSLNNGNDWYVLKPNPIQNMQSSKLVMRTNENKRLTEAMDSSFSLQKLSSITSFNQRLAYCRQHLGSAIGNGSSRVVFQLDDQKCLKLAKNQKGIAQNEHEAEWYKQSLDCFPKIFDYDNTNDSWIVCEYVLPAKPSDFKHCLGLTWDEFVSFIGSCYNEYDRNRFRRTFYSKMPEEQFYELIENNAILHDIYDYMTNYQAPMGDLTRIANYGMVRRYNEDIIVILDHGLSDAIYDEYYKKSH